MRGVIVTALLLASCRSAAPTAELPKRDVAEISPATGAVAAQLLEDPSAPRVKLGPGEEYVQPQLHHENARPQYPRELIAKNLGPHVVALRVTFDEQGHVTGLANSPLAESTEDSFTAEFVDAVTKAVSTWRCYPPRIRKFRPGPDADGDGKPDYRILAAEKVLKTYFDLSFTFDVINGQPVVKQTR
jgi:hypothetical protein